VERQPYGRPLSTLFGAREKTFVDAVEEDLDPIVSELQILNYRYVRLCFHQGQDKFVMFAGWKDPEWTDTQAARASINSEEKRLREVVFGSNLIDIEQKSITRLLVDEVSTGHAQPASRLRIPHTTAQSSKLTVSGFPPLLCISSC